MITLTSTAISESRERESVFIIFKSEINSCNASMKFAKKAGITTGFTIKNIMRMTGIEPALRRTRS